MAIFHVLAVMAFFYVDWGAIALAAALHWLAIGWGIGLGYHRLHTHRSYSAPKWFEYFLAVCGTLTLEGGPIFWVAVHRIHHQKSDQEGDPHTPRDGRWWAHMLWTLFGESLHSNTKALEKYAPDLAKDPFYRALNKWHWVPLTALGLSLWAFCGLPYLLWCVFFRVVFGLHATWLVNSATHLWGSRRFHTHDDSRNSWWVALLTFGEGWHNNHHAHPASARHGMAWYEVDVTWMTIRLLQAVGFVSNVKLPAKAQLEFMQQPIAERRAA
ncbi:MAG: acyl-CoA desaturase [Acidobacteria bacterium]|nr:acyl-CoA desaturase [Acidobacteriota bacterium]